MSETIRSSKERPPRIGDVYSHPTGIHRYRCTATTTKQGDGIQCVIEGCGDETWTSRYSWEAGSCLIHVEGPAPARPVAAVDGPACLAPKWCGLPYDDDRVPVPFDANRSGIAMVYPGAGTPMERPAYCSQSCADRAERTPATASGTGATCSRCGATGLHRCDTKPAPMPPKVAPPWRCSSGEKCKTPLAPEQTARDGLHMVSRKCVVCADSWVATMMAAHGLPSDAPPCAPVPKVRTLYVTEHWRDSEYVAGSEVE